MAKVVYTFAGSTNQELSFFPLRAFRALKAVGRVLRALVESPGQSFIEVQRLEWWNHIEHSDYDNIVILKNYFFLCDIA